MRLNREVQHIVLTRLAQDYPSAVVADFLYDGLSNPLDLAPNVAYLEEHGLAKATYQGPKAHGNPLLRAEITAKGLDFLADDGGLGAILGVVTIKLHDDTLKALIEQKVRGSDLPEPEKKRFLDQLRELPGEATKHLTLKLIDAGLDNWNKALPLLQGFLS